MIWVALFRGINVGGHRKLPMAELRAVVRQIGWTNPQTYIQSGNLVFSADTDPDEIRERLQLAVQKSFGFSTDVLVMSAQTFAATVSCNPYDQPNVDPSRMHIFFHFREPRATEDLRSEGDAGDQITRSSGAHYLKTVNGMSKSKLAEQLTRRLGEDATGRNLRTCRKIMEMVAS